MEMKKKKKWENNSQLKPETKNTIWVVVFFVLSLFFVLSAINSAGVAGKFFYKIFTNLFGIGYFLLPIILILLGLIFLHSKKHNTSILNAISSVLFLASGLGIIDIATNNAGGFVGRVVAYPFVQLFDIYIGILFLGAIFIISILILFNARPNFRPFLKIILSWFGKISLDTTPAEKANEQDNSMEEEDDYKDSFDDALSEKMDEQDNFDEIENEKNEENEEELETTDYKLPAKEYITPPLSLLERDRGKPNVGDIKANSNIIKRTLQNFGIEVEMDEITIGPTVTRYALKPAEGVKLSRIMVLQNDLALALAAHPIRIEAPIPGRSLVGIEIPNKIKSTVGLATLLSDSKFIKSIKALTIVLGKSISGSASFGNISKMPHLLIAGATGSGKSVTIHSIVTSLLYRNGPENLRFIMIDPKRVELTLYNKIPHLLTPVITDAKKTILSLKWAIKEMDRRYDILEAESVRDIESYHNKIMGDKEAKQMPYIVIVIDELADIMSMYPRELESAIVRLAQMSRAVGIHLILSTQRPSVNVITGLIKANIPARIALQVSSQVDSRTILDTGGAEKLLGAGDMLYISGEMSQPIRLQSAFISEEEVKKVASFLIKNYRDEVPSEINLSSDINSDRSIFSSNINDEDDEDDELYEEAKELIIQAKKASTSYLQRKMKVGYARAARLIDMLEDRGIVGPADGAKPREVYENNNNKTEEEKYKNEE